MTSQAVEIGFSAVPLSQSEFRKRSDRNMAYHPMVHTVFWAKLNHMNKMETKGNWNIAKGKLKQKWAKLTDNDLTYIDGKEDELIGRIQKRTGEQREAVEKAVRDAMESQP